MDADALKALGHRTYECNGISGTIQKLGVWLGLDVNMQIVNSDGNDTYKDNDDFAFKEEH